MPTNKHDLPSEIVSALTRDRYKGASSESGTSYSVTQLIAPVQQTILKQRYPEEDNEDVIDNLWSMFGSIAHQLLEEHGNEGETEQRLYAKVIDKTISGGIDNLKDGIITDYKVTACWKIQKGDFYEWEKQLNSYAFLCQQNGLAVNSIRIIAILRDWSAPNGYQPDYPKAPIQIINIKLWSKKEQEAYLKHRVSLLMENTTKSDKELTPCNSEEMWANPDKWAIIKEGAKRATKVCDSKEEALAFVLDKKDYSVVQRTGDRRRCAKYCVVKNRCHQYQTYLKELGYEPQSNEQEALF